MIERNADGIVIVDVTGRMRFMNPAAEQLFGRPSSELLGTEFGLATTPGETAEIDIVRPADADEVVAELRASATTWEGAPAQLIALRDITERRRSEERAHRLAWERAARAQAEEAVRRAEFLAEAARALDSSLDPHVTLRSLSELVVPRVADWCVIDLVEDEVIRRVAAVHVDAELTGVLDELRERYPPIRDERQPGGRVILSGQPELRRGVDPEEIRAVAIDDDHAELLLRLGVRSWMAVPLQAREVRLGAITFVCRERDFSVADLALAQEIGSRAGQALENARLYEAALSASRAKSDFLAIMSHELRTPLNAVLGYTQLLLEGITGELTAPQQQQLERISASATHLLQIIDDILVHASLEAGRLRIEPAEVHIGSLLEETAAIVAPLAEEKGLAFHVELDDSERSLVTDPVRLRQVLLNLLTNAVKFTESGRVTLSASSVGSELRIDIADTGPGIAEADLALIFDAFSQVEGPLTRHAGGTGLGLTVARKIAELLGANISVASRVGEGSTFSVRIPLPAAGRD